MNLEQYKEKYKLTNRDLAKKIGVSDATICHWIKGYCRPTPENIIKILKETKGKVTVF